MSRIQSRLSTRWGHWVPPIAWMGVIFLLSSRSDYPDLTPGPPDLQNILGHVVEYGVLAFLLARAIDRQTHVRRPHLWAIVIVMLYAASDEWHQRFVPGRHADPLDWVIDVAAASVILSLRHWWRRRQKTPSLHPAPDGSGSRRTAGAARR
ncbi:MAG TPA: VanZ family protein [Caldilineae bacterium]|nr:VanZ family protein [Caldilineae bacterium]